MSDALSTYEGAILVVSHNIDFLSKIKPTHILKVENKTAVLIECDEEFSFTEMSSTTDNQYRSTSVANDYI